MMGLEARLTIQLSYPDEETVYPTANLEKPRQTVDPEDGDRTQKR